MKKATNNPTGSEQIEIELADNGIILRDCADPDDVFLALYDRNGEPPFDRDDIYKAIGRDIFIWLMDVLVERHPEHITTGCRLTINAELLGRPMEK